MAFKVGDPWKRDRICAELHVTNGRDGRGRRHAVLRGPTDAIVAVVVRKDGGHKGYLNSLPGKTWDMEGEWDDRGEDLVGGPAVPLFFAHDSTGYRFEGMYRCTGVFGALKRPVYRFVRD